VRSSLSSSLRRSPLLLLLLPTLQHALQPSRGDI